MGRNMDTEYIEGVRELMAAYNESEDAELYRALHELCYAPNEAALRENYAKNAARYAASYDEPELSEYDDLPALLFPVTNEYSVLFDKKVHRFCVDAETGLFALLHILVFGEENAIPQAAERYRRAGDETRGRTLAQELEAAIAGQDFGADTEEKAEEHHRLCPLGELYELFRAEKALAQKDLKKALSYGEAAYAKRKMSVRTCDFLSRAYRALGQLDRSLLFQILSRANPPEHLP